MITLHLPKLLSSRSRKERYIMGGILLATAILYAIGASKNGYANSFYTAAVQAGTVSWKAFFYGSLDASNFVTVDKPPFALWAMELSCRIFGFHAWSMLLPEVLAGVGTVYLVYATVRRWFSARQAVLAAAVMALTPSAVLMFGFNNPDAILTLLLTASVYAVTRALENVYPVRWLSLAAVLTGCAFNTKMLQGLVLLPVLGLVYLLAARPSFWQRCKHLLVAGVVVAVASLWWPTIVTLTPASSRPFIGSSTDNSIWNLIVGYNGVGRLTGSGSGQGGSRIGGAARPTGQRPTGTIPNFGTRTGGRARTGTPPMFASGNRGTMPGGGTGRSGPGGNGFGGSTGILRIFNTDFGPNIAWFIPAGLLGSILVIVRRRRQGRADLQRSAIWLWAGYLVAHIVVFSIVSGVIHPYYVVAMAPAVAALVGISIPEMVASYRRGGNGGLFLPLAIGLTGVTAYAMLGYTNWLPALRLSVLIGGLSLAVIMLLQVVMVKRYFTKALLIAAVVVCAAAPTAYALKTATVVHTGSIPSAGPTGTGMSGSNNEASSAEAALVNYLVKNRGNTNWLVAVASANESAPIQLSSGQPVMAVGGFNGSDNAISLVNFKKLVASGKLRYYAVSSSGRGGSMGGNDAILSWVQSTGTKVNYGGTNYTLYQLKS